ncbi:PREDICTED: bcl-2-binding component 3 [Mandrillus leucophaeus]|uniref:bcl-2-binding component 3 n=1 Tax=Mandrillus leucophaeus TaxID=9568 RepID=UPI0005F450DC|nr:PREDICTED: bcl-2-binding component 3 [Mandrillus leucophaeus]
MLGTGRIKFGVGSARACPCQVPRASSATWVPCQICGPQPSLLLAEQHLESPVPSAPGALAASQRQEEQQRHRPSPWRVLYNLIMGLLPLPRGHRAPEMEPN